MARRARTTKPVPSGTLPPASGTPRRPRTSIPPSLSGRLVENGIVAAAMKVFARRGFATTRVEDVLAEAGIARRTFYRYFTSKDDVLAAVYELATAELLRAVDDLGEAEHEALACLCASIDLYIDFHVENAALLRVLLEQSVRSDSPLAGRRRHFRGRFLRVFVRAADRLRVSPLDGFVYVALLSALEGVTHALIEAVGPGTDNVGRAKRSMHALVASGLTK